MPDVNRKEGSWEYHCSYMPFGVDYGLQEQVEKEKSLLEEKIKKVYQETLACQTLHQKLQEKELELIWSDEDIGVMPFIVIPGTRDSKGVVATNFESEKEMDFLHGTITVHKPNYFNALKEVYSGLQKYGISVEFRLFPIEKKHL